MKKRRLDLGLRQKDVAQQIGVTTFTIINWETGATQPRVDLGPKIIGFLGYDPLPTSRNVG